MSVGHVNGGELTPENLAEDVVAVAKALREKYNTDISLFLMGHSWGGTLGSTVLIEESNQALFKGWIDVDGAHNYPLMFEAGVREIRKNAVTQINKGNSISFWEEIIDSLDLIDTTAIDFSYINSTAYTAEQRLLTDDELDIDPSALLQSLGVLLFVNNPLVTSVNAIFSNATFIDNGLLSYDVSDQLFKIMIPSLILWGEFDMVVSPELAEEAFEKIGSENKFLHYFDRSGHSPMVNQPEEFAQEVASFVEQFK
jgi:pimeloyl-ACP methyl ester carboxylesterase